MPAISHVLKRLISLLVSKPKKNISNFKAVVTCGLWLSKLSKYSNRKDIGSAVIINGCKEYITNHSLSSYMAEWLIYTMS
jgi:hypothetical protein